MPIKFLDTHSRVVTGDEAFLLPGTVQVETGISSAIMLEARGAKVETELFAPKASRDERINQPVGQLLTVTSEVAGPDGIITLEHLGIVAAVGDVQIIVTTEEEKKDSEHPPLDDALTAETAIEETSVFVEDAAAPEQTTILAEGNITIEETPVYEQWFDVYWDPNTETLVQALYIWDGFTLQVIV
jgi:hypothetical protein